MTSVTAVSSMVTREYYVILPFQTFMAQNTFSTTGEDAITRTIDVHVDETASQFVSEQDFDDFYEINKTAEDIVKGDYKRVSCTRHVMQT